MPWFRFVTKTVSTTPQCVNCCWAVLAACQGILCFSLCPNASRLRWEGTQLGQQTPADQGVIPCCIMSFSAIKWRGQFSQGNHHSKSCWASVCWWEVVRDCLCITWFYVLFLHLLNYLYQVFLTFAISFFAPSHWRGVSEWRGGDLAASQSQPTTNRQDLFGHSGVSFCINQVYHTESSRLQVW